jgi:excinuclease ABC subunit C
MSDHATSETHLQIAVRNLPHQPGIYQFFDAENTLIYVGKAKDLRKRVGSYFLKTANHSGKTRSMVSQIANMKFTVVTTEWEAFLLENNFIKENQPKYNILLRDDKTYPYICITNEPYPRIYSTRRIVKSKGKYFGPYSNVKAMHNVLELAAQLFNIRKCDLNITDKAVQNQKFKVCLEYHIGNCKAPCIGLQSRLDYQESIKETEHLVKGNIQMPRKYLTEAMNQHAASLEFEQAENYKKKLDLLEKHQSASIVSNTSIEDIFILTIISNDDKVHLNFIKVQGGNIIYSENYSLTKVLEEPEEDILFYKMFDIFSKETLENTIEIFTNIETTYTLDKKIIVSTPKIGIKKKLVDMSVSNLQEYIRHKEINKLDRKEDSLKTLKKLQEDLRLPELPVHIECFDNSNLQGTNPVSAMVCFKNGKPSKKDYRHFKVKNIEGPNDFDTMKEVVHRRYSRLLDEKQPLPNLILIDGGKGQLNAAIEVLKELKIYEKISIISIAKRLEEIYFPNDEFPLHLHKKSPTMLLLQHLRDEAHRFGITFHRNLRSKAVLKQ